VPTVTRTTIPTTEPTLLPDPLDDAVSATSFFQWGLAFASQGEYKAARSEFEKSLARDPHNLETWYHLGVCDEALGYVDQARNVFAYVLQIDPTFTPATTTEGESALFLELSTLFLELQANMTPPDTFIEFEKIQSEWFTYFLMGALLVIVVLFASSFVVRQHYHKVPAPPVTTIHTPRQILSSETINAMADQAMEYFDGDRSVIVELLTIASELAAEGREGKHIGTAFILGDTERVLEYSRQLILNPFEGHTEENRCILSPHIHESIKELAQMDGAFIIRDDGVVVAAGRYITVDTSEVRIPGGFGTRHLSTAAITEATSALGVVVSESGGAIRIFAKGNIIASNKM
jgi:DNA integrity scanning protein DisA with diadenylate cyclase activity